MKAARSSTLFIACIGLVALLAGCSTTRDLGEVSKLDDGGDGLRIVLMPLDVELSLMQASGITEPNAEWTATGKTLLKQEITSYVAQHGGALVQYDADIGDLAADAPETRIIKLHRAVGNTILYTKIGTNPMPTKKNSFDWTLGPSVQVLRDKFNADYAMFVFVRDSYTSTGRAFMMIGAAILGVGLQGGNQAGFVSLVDLRTGDVSWFNFLASSTGDLRNEEGAKKTVAKLLDNLPQ